MDVLEEQLSNHSYHYDRDSVVNIPEPELPNLPPPEEEQTENKKDNKKKSRRRKRMLTGVSKQRRAANERERKRLQIINAAFKELKNVLPLFPAEEPHIPKIEIVRLATKTIAYLSEMLNNDDSSSTIASSPRGSETSEGSMSSEDSQSTSSSSSSPLSPVDDELQTFLLNHQLPNDNFTLFDVVRDEYMHDQNGFHDMDINSFIKDNTDLDDVFPSMLFP